MLLIFVTRPYVTFSPLTPTVASCLLPPPLQGE